MNRRVRLWRFGCTQVVGPPLLDIISLMGAYDHGPDWDVQLRPWQVEVPGSHRPADDKSPRGATAVGTVSRRNTTVVRTAWEKAVQRRHTVGGPGDFASRLVISRLAAVVAVAITLALVSGCSSTGADRDAAESEQVIQTGSASAPSSVVAASVDVPVVSGESQPELVTAIHETGNPAGESRVSIPVFLVGAVAGLVLVALGAGVLLAARRQQRLTGSKP